MKTDDLISMLAAGGAAVEAGATRRRYATALGWGAFGATLLMALFLGVRPDLAEAVRLPMFWVKLAFPIAVAVIACATTGRLSRPGAGLGRLPGTLAGCVLAIWLLAGLALLNTEPEARNALIFGTSWYVCPLLIAGLSIPPLASVLWAMQGLAPTRLALAGGAAGLLAGGLGAAAYALYCDEMGAPFLAIWYLAGMLIPALAGALLARPLLRW